MLQVLAAVTLDGDYLSSHHHNHAGHAVEVWDGEKYDCKPSLAGWKKYNELLVINGAQADKAGFSLLL